jgi:hypothetical protein
VEAVVDSASSPWWNGELGIDSTDRSTTSARLVHASGSRLAYRIERLDGVHARRGSRLRTGAGSGRIHAQAVHRRQT